MVALKVGRSWVAGTGVRGRTPATQDTNTTPDSTEAYACRSAGGTYEYLLPQRRGHGPARFGRSVRPESPGWVAHLARSARAGWSGRGRSSRDRSPDTHRWWRRGRRG